MQIFKFQRRTPVVARLFSFPAPSVRAHPKSLLKYGPQREREMEKGRWRYSTVIYLHVLIAVWQNKFLYFSVGITVVTREIKDNAYAKPWGANKVYNGRCANGELEKRKKGKSPFSLSIPPSFSFTSPPLLTVPHASGNKVSFIHDVSSLFPSRQGWDLRLL